MFALLRGSLAALVLVVAGGDRSVAPLVTTADDLLQVARLRCESQSNPLAVDRLRPRLSWTLTSEVRGARQSAYRVRVASDPALLAWGFSDRWDSGKTPSARSIQVVYDGEELRSAERVYWQVRVWDEAGLPSPWSPVATWTMGLLDPADWHARWIAAPEDAPAASLAGARWIWGTTTSSPDAPPPATWWFTKEFALPADPRVEDAMITITADNEYVLFVNEVEVGRDLVWNRGESYLLSDRLRSGETNRIRIRAVNSGVEPSSAGVVARLVVRFADGGEFVVGTDDTWRAVPEGEEEGRAARTLAAYGAAPWGEFPLHGPPAHRSPLLRGEWGGEEPVVRATVYVSGLGHHELFVNGTRVGDRFLDPAWSTYEKTTYYATHDVTALLREGTNAFGVMLGKGFYDTRGDRRNQYVYAGGTPTLILQLLLELEDGTRRVFGTDASWRWTRGPHLHDSILGGCDYDARRMPQGWSEPGFDDAAWSEVVETGAPVTTLVAAASPPLRVFDELGPVSVDEPAPGHGVWDFGRNLSARPRLRVRGPAGATVRLTHGEMRHGSTPGRDDGAEGVDQTGIGTPSYIEYTLRGGGEETWFPPFFYAGFRYLEVTGAVPAGRPNPDGRPEILSLTSQHVRADAEEIGRFACSNERFNRIAEIVDRSVRSNLSHVFTDCPHREKLGWMETSYLMGPSIAFRYDTSRLLAKVARDIRDAQTEDGLVFMIAPDYPACSETYRFSTEWGVAAVFVPWLAYRWYGDEAVLAESYSSMTRYVDHLAGYTGEEGVLPPLGAGDWYDHGHGEDPGVSRYTPIDLTATATLIQAAALVARVGEVLDRPSAEVARYEELAARLRRGFRARYLDAAAAVFTHLGSPQTANAIGFAAGAVTLEEEESFLTAIVDDLRRRGHQHTTGEIGHRYLLRALADHGRSEVIFRMTDREERGSYGGIVAGGWTSMVETWDAREGWSKLHGMLGHILEWFQGDVAGIRLHPTIPAFREFEVAPHVVGDLTWARASHRSPYGEIRVEWRRRDEAFELDLDVPVNSVAHLVLPTSRPESVRESGAVISDAPGVTFLRAGESGAEYRVESGRYRFRCAPLSAGEESSPRRSGSTPLPW